MIVALSILNVASQELEKKIEDFCVVKNNWIHFDVMDGRFVENKTFAYEMVKKVGDFCSFFKDVHLMTYDPKEDLEQYKNAGTDQITFHYESVDDKDVMMMINAIKDKNMKVGISVKPSTNIEVIEKYLPYLDLVLVMSVEPGKGGQKFMEESLYKIEWLKKRQKDNHYLISVDGGINADTSKLVKDKGADVVVVGSYLTKGNIDENKITSVM